MGLTVTKKIINVLDEDEITELIKEVYGFSYNIANKEDISYCYGAYYPFSVDEADLNYEYDEIDEYSSLQSIFIDLVIKGHLCMGVYYIWIEY